jgi:5-methylthioadenosine/S-adenosylhomocysteine deaminase
MIEALKFGALNVKGIRQDPRVIGARDVFRLATVGGARGVGLPDDLGAIEPGRLADLFLFDPYRLKSVPVHDPISSLVYASGESNVDTVIVDGRVVMAGGRLTTIDEAAFVREVHDRALALSERIGTFRLLRGRRLQPYGWDREPEPKPAERADMAVGEAIEGERLDNPSGRSQHPVVLQ